ncbi:MAG: hypothetical protein JO319_09420 [Acidobacteriaceae bacterium]|nr:hypothetical protein [Acidobacteriaceae bacterium]
MSAPLVPSPLDYIGRRRFAFYPAIRNALPNEWVLGTGSRTEVQVVNAELGYELWISRQHIGAVSEGEGALLVVGLTKELDFRGGALEPRVKRVIEMPHSGTGRDRQDADSLRPAAPAPVVGIRLEQTESSRMDKAVVVLCIAAVVTALLGALVAAAARL